MKVGGTLKLIKPRLPMQKTRNLSAETAEDVLKLAADGIKGIDENLKTKQPKIIDQKKISSNFNLSFNNSFNTSYNNANQKIVNKIPSKLEF